MRNRTKQVLSALIAAVCVLAAVLSVWTFFDVRAHAECEVLGESMAPTLDDGQNLVMNVTVRPENGDIVIFDAEPYGGGVDKDGKHVNYIKRLIGSAGDELRFLRSADGETVRIERNGVPLEEPYICEPMLLGSHFDGNFRDITSVFFDVDLPLLSLLSREGSATFTVPEGAMWVMGDNRNHSHDSRAIGFVRVGDLVGVAKDTTPLAERFPLVARFARGVSIFAFLIAAWTLLSESFTQERAEPWRSVE